MSKKSRLALGVSFLGAALLLPTFASAWWGGDRWRDRDRWYDDGPGYYRHGGPGYWGGGPYGWGGGPGHWGGGPWGWGGYPGYYGHPYGAAPVNTEQSTPPPLPE
jgi:hypothetical protein